MNRKDRKALIDAAGYDCFGEESFTDEDRDFLYSSLKADLDDGAPTDRHSIAQLAEMEKTLLQIRKIDRCINAQLALSEPDAALVGKLSTVKSTLLSAASSAAAELGLAKKSAPVRTSLTAVMKEMYDSGFEECKVDTVSAKLSGSYKEIAQQNAQALIAELSLTGDEFAQLTAVQSQAIKALQEKTELLEEQLRLERLRNKGGGMTS